ncbi:hypothetical protein ACLVWU_08580 [Bdellovibrio sp. HCB290]|uniref:hypothetical protein n=1 Tax=Bdellovibrio sp. HCB290 TaxID=3394356 RepID=UPI0039B5F2C5
MDKTEMNIRLTVYNFPKAEIERIKLRGIKPSTVAIKGKVIQPSLAGARTTERKWKETFVDFTFPCKDLNFEKSVKSLITKMVGFRKDKELKAVKFGITCEVYMKDERPEISLSENTIKLLAGNKCYLEFSIY